MIEGHPKCGVKHGHSYQLVCRFAGATEKFEDFAEIKQRVDEYVQPKYDHQDIGDKTAEEIAGDICAYLTSFGYDGEIELSETAKFSVTLQFGRAYAEATQEDGGIKYQHYKDTLKVVPHVSNQ
jgi:6-pyruvoyl-tetrahydropterin synthase